MSPGAYFLGLMLFFIPSYFHRLPPVVNRYDYAGVGETQLYGVTILWIASLSIGGAISIVPNERASYAVFASMLPAIASGALSVRLPGGLAEIFLYGSLVTLVACACGGMLSRCVRSSQGGKPQWKRIPSLLFLSRFLVVVWALVVLLLVKEAVSRWMILAAAGCVVVAAIADTRSLVRGWSNHTLDFAALLAAALAAVYSDVNLVLMQPAREGVDVGEVVEGLGSRARELSIVICATFTIPVSAAVLEHCLRRADWKRANLDGSAPEAGEGRKADQPAVLPREEGDSSE